MYLVPPAVVSYKNFSSRFESFIKSVEKPKFILDVKNGIPTIKRICYLGFTAISRSFKEGFKMESARIIIWNICIHTENSGSFEVSD